VTKTNIINSTIRSLKNSTRTRYKQCDQLPSYTLHCETIMLTCPGKSLHQYCFHYNFCSRV